MRKILIFIPILILLACGQNKNNFFYFDSNQDTIWDNMIDSIVLKKFGGRYANKKNLLFPNNVIKSFGLRDSLISFINNKQLNNLDEIVIFEYLEGGVNRTNNEKYSYEAYIYIPIDSNLLVGKYFFKKTIPNNHFSEENVFNDTIEYPIRDFRFLGRDYFLKSGIKIVTNVFIEKKIPIFQIEQIYLGIDNLSEDTTTIFSPSPSETDVKNMGRLPSNLF